MTFRPACLRIPRLFCAVLLAASAQFALAATDLPSAHLISPEQLVKILQSGRTKPLILNVGPHTLYQQAHIPGAEYIGPGNEGEGRRKLHQRVQRLPRNTFIVLYCGCCPWANCPNVNPAYSELQQMGFSNAKVLKIQNDLGTDWVYKNYPTVRGTP